MYGVCLMRPTLLSGRQNREEEHITITRNVWPAIRSLLLLSVEAQTSVLYIAALITLCFMSYIHPFSYRSPMSRYTLLAHGFGFPYIVSIKCQSHQVSLSCSQPLFHYRGKETDYF